MIPWPTTIFFACALFFWPALVCAEDPLDRVTGTEDWQSVAGVDIEAEWRSWLKAREAWRKARRQLRSQHKRNQRLAKILRAARRTGRWNELHRLGWGGLRKKRVLLEQVRVPVERFDKNGQAIDLEGDQVLRRAIDERPQKRRKRR